MKHWLALAALIFFSQDSIPAGQAGDRVMAWTVEHSDFGGFSAIEVTPDGHDFIALTDQGVIFSGRFERADDGAVAIITAGEPTYLADQSGQRLPPARNDTEGLALRADGSFLVSFEGPAEVMDYAGTGAAAVSLGTMPDWRQLATNAGLEAVAIRETGAVVTVPEQALGPQNRIFVHSDGQWRLDHSIDKPDGFHPVAADFGPDGRFFLLERHLVLPGGFASRLRRFDGDDMQKGEVIWHSPPGAYGNLEGMSVWKNPAGRIVATMISDDNFLPLLQTQLVEVEITN